MYFTFWTFNIWIFDFKFGWTLKTRVYNKATWNIFFKNFKKSLNLFWELFFFFSKTEISISENAPNYSLNIWKYAKYDGTTVLLFKIPCYLCYKGKKHDVYRKPYRFTVFLLWFWLLFRNDLSSFSLYKLRITHYPIPFERPTHTIAYTKCKEWPDFFPIILILRFCNN